MPKIIVYALLLFSQLSYADCESLIDSANKKLGYPDRETATENWFSDCKVWPADPDKSILALAHLQKTVPVDPEEYKHNLDVLLVNTESGKILQHFFQEGAFVSNAVALSGIMIDTARYKLAPEIRAFGVRATFKSNSHMYSVNDKIINLYVSKNQKLKLVLADLIMNDDSNSGQFDMVGEDSCTITESNTQRTLAIAKTASHGYADLLLQEKTSKSESKLVKNECITATTPTTKQYTLHFNDDVYEVPDELQYK